MLSITEINHYLKGIGIEKADKILLSPDTNSVENIFIQVKN